MCIYSIIHLDIPHTSRHNQPHPFTLSDSITNHRSSEFRLEHLALHQRTRNNSRRKLC
ncbi:hypothetical protein Hdeb2414_s0281g00856121 [Helianthus debilis subsp. tardiflorus]